jgi:hypothetical protein
MHFEILLRVVVTEIKSLGGFVRATLALPAAQRPPSNEEFQRRVGALWRTFLREASKLLEVAEKEKAEVNTYNITIKDIVGPVNVLSKLDGVVQSVHNSPTLTTQLLVSLRTQWPNNSFQPTYLPPFRSDKSAAGAYVDRPLWVASRQSLFGHKQTFPGHHAKKCRNDCHHFTLDGSIENNSAQVLPRKRQIVPKQ